MADPIPIRPITVSEYGAFRRVHDHAFNSGPRPEARTARALRQFEPERSLAAVDAALPAGEAAAGLVTELRPGSLTPLPAAMTWAPAPWCRRIF